MHLFSSFSSPLRFIKSRPYFYDIANETPYVQVYGRLLQDVFGGSHAFYRIDSPSLEVASVEILVALQDQLSMLFEALPDGIVQLQWHFVTSGNYQEEIHAHSKFPSDSPIANILRGERVLQWEKASRQRKLQRVSTILVVSCLPGGMASHGRQEKEPRRFRPLTEALSHAAAQMLTLAQELLEASLQRVGISLRTMDAAEIAEFFYALWNPELSQGLGIPCRFDPEEGNFMDAWLCQDWLLEKDAWQVGSFRHAFVSMEAKPQQSMPRLIERLTTGTGLADLHIVLSLRRLEKCEEIQRLRGQRNRALQKMREPLSLIDRLENPKGRVDPMTAQYHVEARMEAEDANQLLSEIHSGRETQCLAQLVVHTWAKTREESEESRGILLQAMSDMESARGVAETFGTHAIFQSSLPGSLMPLPRWVRMKTRMASDLTPLHNGFETGEKPLCLFRGSSGGLVSLNLFDHCNIDAPLAFVSGSSGSGKSFLVNQLLLQHLGVRPRIVILDMGGSYARLVRLLGGQMVSLEEDHPICLNPLGLFALKEEPSPSVRGRICRIIEEMASDKEPLTCAMGDRLDIALESLFCRSRAEGLENLTIDDLVRFLSRGDSLARDLADRLQPFTAGQRYADWFCGETCLDMRGDLVCFDLKGIRRDARLCRVMIPILIHLLHDMLGADRLREKILVMDEMWDFIRNPRLVEFVIEAWKTFRKENTVTLGVTQNLGADIADHPEVGAAIIQNTETWFLLDQGRPQQMEKTCEILELTEGEREILARLRRGNRKDDHGDPEFYRSALMIRGRRNGVRNSGEIRISPLPKEYWMATTTPMEAAFFDQTLSASAGNLEVALDHLAKHHPYGL